MNQPSVSTPVAWIVGASSGIGHELACRFAEAGYSVIVSARRELQLQQLQQKYPEQIIPLPLDVTDSESVAKAYQQLDFITDHINLFLYNSGIAKYTSRHDDNWFQITRKVYDVNILGFTRCLDIALPKLRKAQGLRHIAAVSSLSSYLAMPRAEAYGSSKAAMQYFLDALRTDLYSENIKVTVINPGFVDTPMTQKNDFPMPGLWSSEKAADFIFRKLAKQPAEIRFPTLLIMVLRLASWLPKGFFSRHAQFLVKD